LGGHGLVVAGSGLSKTSIVPCILLSIASCIPQAAIIIIIIIIIIEKSGWLKVHPFGICFEQSGTPVDQESMSYTNSAIDHDLYIKVQKELASLHNGGVLLCEQAITSNRTVRQATAQPRFVILPGN
jgi:hypothetical protein